ncbi:DUF455 family protein [Mariniblastus fucicola]|uniref:DUF455 domain-containing protein n=1 Tax=Mariniblastus fucicola TaxID=980251 RepID=A0A5B9PGT9_9BACT|nr:DUF455 family protein [Mariniblastus fucicola]QEG23972.1 hypothetical protein MFFC18_38770 [Mariniblastus fucicola]
MNITEFAEQVVFSNSLEEKLAAPGKLSFDRHTSARLVSEKSLRTPGRPSHLLMQHQPGRNVQPPREDQLENEKSRGQLLHFLANHELLATELMALVLLKFPNAPRAFRQGVLVTLQEEQLHTRMYLERMKQCGVEFGTWPVSGQFWRIVEPMDSPMDFVSRLSLTFEQANLDFSLHYSKVFARIGDHHTAGLLQKIYEDEIGHVQHGLHWFRQWKEPGKSDFDAWQETLDFPMSPGRARGPRSCFNREGRRKAGLSDEFIDAIEIFGQSKDRSAAVRWFDPGAEAELRAANLQARGDQTDPMMQQLGKELEFVLVALSKPDDMLLVRELPSQELQKHWVDAGVEFPEFCLFEDQQSLLHRKLNRLEPWAWTPANQVRVETVRNSVRHQPGLWLDSQAELFRKSWAANKIDRWFDSANETPSWMAGVECSGIPVGNQYSLDEALSQIASRGFDVAIYKHDLGSSGRGMHRIATRKPAPQKQFRSDIEAIVEPWLERVVDLSFLWHVDQAGELKFLGWTRPLVSKGGRYEGTKLGSPFYDCDPEVRKFLLSEKCLKLKLTQQWLERNLLPELTSRQFRGNFGVDAFVFRNRESSLKIRPFVELNPRTTMGHVALAIEKRTADGAKGMFRVLTQSQYRSQKDRLESLAIEFDSHGRWKSGVVWFGERSDSAKLIPCVIIEPPAGKSAHKKTRAKS